MFISVRRLFLFLLFIPLTLKAQEKTICITVDDLPVASYSYEVDQQEVTEQLVSFFAEHNIPAIGFVVENKLYENGKLDPYKVELLEYWLEHGLELGNHTFSHQNYHLVGNDVFTKNILDGEKISKPLSLKYGKPYHYLRHPYLKSGKTKEQADSLSSFLAKNDYLEAPITIDNLDYQFAEKYATAFVEGDTGLMKKIGDAYIQYSAQKIEYYEQISDTLFDRQIPQVFLIHASKLNADYIDDLHDLFIEKGYSFSSMDEVLSDEAYLTPVTRFNDWGISWLERWAISQRVGMDILKTDPPVPDFINN